MMLMGIMALICISNCASESLDLNFSRYDSRHEKTYLVRLRPAWIQKSLRIHTVSSGSILFAIRPYKYYRNLKRTALILMRLRGCILVANALEDGDYWWYNSLKRVSESKCGRNIALTFEDDKTIYLRYDGAPLNGTCVVNITIYNPISRYSIICMVLQNVYSYPKDFDCSENFRFYFGVYPTRKSEKYYSCSDIRQPFCDYDYNSRGYAAFNSWDSSENKSTIDVKLYVLSGFPRRPTTSRPTFRTESTWSSWSSDDDSSSNKSSAGTSLLIIGLIAGGVFILIFCIYFCQKVAAGSQNTGRQSDTARESNGADTSYEQRNQDQGSRFVEYVTDMNELPSSDTLDTNDRDSSEASRTRHQVNFNRPEPSAPNPESHEETTLEDPPPSYRSLFGNS